jgi:hypothetical protein
MKNLIKYILVVITTISFSYCSLDTDLYQNIPTKDAFKGVQDVQNGLNGTYQGFGDYTFYGNYLVAIGDMASDVAEASASSGHFVAINQWTINEYTTELLDVWSAGYTVIDRATRTIIGGEALLKAATENNLSAGDIKQLNSYLSQAYSLRALSDFYLVNLFGLPYKAGTPNSQLGIVLVTTKPIEPFETVHRATVGETYTQILADIAQAKKYMTNGTQDENQYYFNEAAIYAMEARVKMFMQDYAGAITAAQTAIDLRASDDETFESYVAMWKSTAITKEDIFTIVKSDNDNLSANALNTLYGSYGGTLSTFTIEQFSSNDIRLGLIGNDDDPSHPKKFDGTATAQAVSNIPVFRKSEMYLILAEANANLNNLSEAKNALLYTAKRDKSITSVADLPSTKSELLSFISAECIREFFEEGHRWYDLRRRGELATIAGSENFDMSKFVFPIPDAEVKSGAGVVQNENWSNALP